MTRLTEIEREIEATRARLDLTLDELQQHATLAHLADDAVGYLRAKGADKYGRRVLAVARSNPLPVALIALGAGWLAKAYLSRDARRDDRGAERSGSFDTQRARQNGRLKEDMPVADAHDVAVASRETERVALDDRY